MSNGIRITGELLLTKDGLGVYVSFLEPVNTLSDVEIKELVNIRFTNALNDLLEHTNKAAAVAAAPQG